MWVHVAQAGEDVGVAGVRGNAQPSGDRAQNVHAYRGRAQAGGVGAQVGAQPREALCQAWRTVRVEQGVGIVQAHLHLFHRGMRYAAPTASPVPLHCTPGSLAPG